jgi:septum site-determining protein MinD
MNAGSAKPGKSIAIVSGKGGSGKTIIASVMMQIIAENGKVVLIDTDAGTGGLTFYLGLDLVAGTSTGLSDLLTRHASEEIRTYDQYVSELSDLLRSVKEMPNARFLSVGDRRKMGRISSVDLRKGLKNLVLALESISEFSVFDCRGGIDDESLAVCDAVDDIILIVETDTTSYQATQQLVETLVDNGLAHKLRGFIINKVFEDPSVVARNGTAVFRCQYLAAVPFDFDAMRSFFVGRIPSLYSSFSVHVQHALNHAYSDSIPAPLRRTYTFEDYEEIGLVNLDSLRGGIITAMAIMVCSILLAFYWWHPPAAIHIKVPESVALLAGLGLVGSLSSPRQFVGRAVNRAISSLLVIRRR